MYTLIVVSLVVLNNVTLTLQTSPISLADCLVMQQEFVDSAEAMEKYNGAKLQYVQCVQEGV